MPVLAESNVQAIVCRDPATLAIVQPVSDSIVNSTIIMITGTVTQSTQIEVQVDGQFDGVVPLDAAAIHFTTSVQLAPGTHTISLTAIDVCQIGNATDQVVVTYQPLTPSDGGSVGSQTPTTVPSESGVVISAAGEAPLTSAAPVSPFAKLLQPLVDVGRTLDLLHAPGVPPASSLTPQPVRLGLIVAGFGVLLFSTYFTIMFAGAAKIIGLHPHLFGRWTIRFVGIGLILLAFMLA